MLFMLETELRRVAGNYFKAEEDWGVDFVRAATKGYGGVLITGQNPSRAAGVAEAILGALR